MAKKHSSPPPNPYEGFEPEDLFPIIAQQKTEIDFLKEELMRASKTIWGLVQALNEKKTTMQVPDRPPIKVKPPRFYNPATKEYEEPSKDEISQFQEDCSEILGFVPATIAITEDPEQ